MCLLKHKYFYFQEYKIDQIFGRNYGKYLEEFKLSGYDIQHELNFAYFHERLKLAHVEVLKIEQMKSRYEEEKSSSNWDDLGYDD